MGKGCVDELLDVRTDSCIFINSVIDPFIAVPAILRSPQLNHFADELRMLVLVKYCYQRLLEPRFFQLQLNFQPLGHGFGGKGHCELIADERVSAVPFHLFNLFEENFRTHVNLFRRLMVFRSDNLTT